MDYITNRCQIANRCEVDMITGNHAEAALLAYRPSGITHAVLALVVLAERQTAAAERQAAALESQHVARHLRLADTVPRPRTAR
ncbi:hypothetical protein [Streptomyces sp. NPDC005303]|uniref:hypothetical protein n=1 Tax=Streptomyces sp. NPDC005303 TaxID=3155713 RepID=UPI0033BF11D8